MKLSYGLLLTLLALTGCGSSQSSGPDQSSGSPRPATKESLAAQDKADFEMLETLFWSKENLLKTHCQQNQIPCPDFLYPKVKNQLGLLNYALPVLKPLVDFQPHDTHYKTEITPRIEKYRTLYSQLESQQRRLSINVPLIEGILNGQKDQFTKITQEKESARAALAKLGCTIHDSGQIDCPGETKSIADGVLHLKQSAASITYKSALEAEIKYYDQFPQPGLQAARGVKEKYAKYQETALSLKRCWADVEAIEQEVSAHPPAGLPIDATKFFEHLKHIQSSVCDADLMEKLSVKLSQLQKLYASFDELRDLLHTRAFDHISIGNGYKPYRDEAYNWDPRSGSGLDVMFPYNLTTEQLSNYIKTLDIADNTKWRNRAVLIQKVALGLTKFPKTYQGTRASFKIIIAPEFEPLGFRLPYLANLLNEGSDGWVNKAMNLIPNKSWPATWLPNEFTIVLGTPHFNDTLQAYNCPIVTSAKVMLNIDNAEFCSSDVIENPQFN